MNNTIKLSIVEMELAGMWAKLQSMRQTMVESQSTEGKQMDEIANQIDSLRSLLANKIELGS